MPVLDRPADHAENAGVDLLQHVELPRFVPSDQLMRTAISVDHSQLVASAGVVSNPPERALAVWISGY